MENPIDHFDSDPSNPEALVTKAKREIFAKLTDILKTGRFYPEREHSRAEYVSMVNNRPYYVVTVAAEEHDDPKEIKGQNTEPEINRHTYYWFYPESILVHHQDNINEDPSGNPEWVDLDEKHEIDPEELLHLHAGILGTQKSPAQSNED